MLIKNNKTIKGENQQTLEKLEIHYFIEDG